MNPQEIFSIVPNLFRGPCLFINDRHQSCNSKTTFKTSKNTGPMSPIFLNSTRYFYSWWPIASVTCSGVQTNFINFQFSCRWNDSMNFLRLNPCRNHAQWGLRIKSASDHRQLIPRRGLIQSSEEGHGKVYLFMGGEDL